VIGVREPQPAASEAFVKFADAHRSIEKFGIRLLKTIKPVGPTAQMVCVQLVEVGRVVWWEGQHGVQAPSYARVRC
jgi:hypothetical protein